MLHNCVIVISSGDRFSAADIHEHSSRLQALIAVDRQRKQLEQSVNDLEAWVYDTKDKFGFSEGLNRFTL